MGKSAVQGRHRSRRDLATEAAAQDTTIVVVRPVGARNAICKLVGGRIACMSDSDRTILSREQQHKRRGSRIGEMWSQIVPAGKQYDSAQSSAGFSVIMCAVAGHLTTIPKTLPGSLSQCSLDLFLRLHPSSRHFLPDGGIGNMSQAIEQISCPRWQASNLELAVAWSVLSSRRKLAAGSSLKPGCSFPTAGDSSNA
nr:hypothetical protein CFP56_56986 [Quercus suber]